MNFSDYFPIWEQLTEAEKKKISESVSYQKVRKGTVLHSGSSDCTGLLLVCTGQLRAYILSEEGREITIYRLFDRDICLLSASCMMQGLRFEVTVEAKQDTQLWVVPAEIYKQIMEESVAVANYTNEIMADRFSEVMWLVEQILWKSVDKRLAEFLMEESRLTGSTVLKITHEAIANHMGTAREVVTRMLRYFQSEGMVKLSRGKIEIIDDKKLQKYV